MMFSRRDLDRLNGILAEAARREIMPRFGRLAAGEVREKAAPGDLVTEADEAAERLIFAELERAFPGALLVGPREACPVVAGDPLDELRVDVEVERAAVVLVVGAQHEAIGVLAEAFGEVPQRLELCLRAPRAGDSVSRSGESNNIVR